MPGLRSAGLDVPTTAPAAPSRIFPSTQTIVDQHIEATAVPVAVECPLRLDVRPDIVAFSGHLLAGLPGGRTDEIRLVARDHLLAVAPQADPRTDRSEGHVLRRPRRIGQARIAGITPHLGIGAPDPDIGPVHRDITVIGIVLVAGQAEDDFLLHLPPDRLPRLGSLVLVLDGPQGRRDGGRAAPGLDEQRPGLVVEDVRLDQFGALRVIGIISLEDTIAPFGDAPQVFRRRIAGIVHLQVGIAGSIGIDDVVDETLLRIETPGSLGTQAHVVVLGARNELRSPLSVAQPMETAAGIDQAVDLIVRGVQQETDHGVVVIQFRVAGHDGARCPEDPVFRGAGATDREQSRQYPDNLFHIRLGKERIYFPLARKAAWTGPILR